ncbi:MAG: hypothetical protein BMS9Abin32_408 [Gammaproteobacteria bacterium]|nr:MAG: hypothetical protein BMS9Abin32_408 [Gammaproteobacteria bacterium]
MKYLLPIILIGALSVAAIAPAEPSAPGDLEALLQDADRVMDNDYLADWAFTETTVEPESSTVGRYDPSRAASERWTLLSIDGREPTAEEAAEFAAEQAEEYAESPDGGDDVSSMVEPGSLRLVQETDAYWLFSFTPSEDEEDENFAENVDGTLQIVKQGPYVEFVALRSRKPFKPQFGVKIHDFLMRLRFGPAVDGGPIVPLSMDFEIDASAFLVKRVRETVKITFSDYRHVGGN